MAPRATISKYIVYGYHLYTYAVLYEPPSKLYVSDLCPWRCISQSVRGETPMAVASTLDRENHLEARLLV